MAVLSLRRAVRWSIGIYPRRLIPTTTQLALRRDLGAEFGRRNEEVRTVSARSRRAALSWVAPANPLPPLPMPFFPNTHRPSLPLVLRRLAHFPSEILSIPIRHQHPFFYGSHPCPMSSFALFPPLPPIHKERERRRLKKSHPLREGRIALVDMAGRYSFSDGEGTARTTRSATPSDVSSVDEHVL